VTLVGHRLAALSAAIVFSFYLIRRRQGCVARCWK